MINQQGRVMPHPFARIRVTRPNSTMERYQRGWIGTIITIGAFAGSGAANVQWDPQFTSNSNTDMLLFQEFEVIND